jgi:hypothetical protein
MHRIAETKLDIKLAYLKKARKESLKNIIIITTGLILF